MSTYRIRRQAQRPAAHGYVAACARIAESRSFQGFIYAVILANAVVLGMSTYPEFERNDGRVLELLNEVFLMIFAIELVIRISAFGRRPQDFFRSGWNVFDFVVISLGFVPGLRKSATLLRLARLLRVVRLASVRGDLRAVAVGMVRSIPAISSLLLMVTLVVYFYAMIGWLMFAEQDPEHWGTLGRSMLTLFTVSTLEGWNVILYEAQETMPAAWIFFVSFVLLISFLVLNIVMGILLNSIEREREAALAARPQGERTKVDTRLDALRGALAELEGERAREEAEPAGVSEEERRRVDARLGALHRAVLDLEAELEKYAREREAEDEGVPRVIGRRAGRAV